MRNRDIIKDLQGLMEMLDDWDLLHSSETVRDARDEIIRLRLAVDVLKAELRAELDRPERPLREGTNE